MIKEKAALHLVRLQAVRAQEIAFISRLLVVESNGENRLSNHTLNYKEILNILPETSRIVKKSDLYFEVLIASSNLLKETEHNYKNKRIKLLYGDYSPFT